MESKFFKCTFLSDVILNSVTATEGNQKSLDYIPGSTFLGIAAKNYQKCSNPYNIFHSGIVQFGDGHISRNNKRSLKRPSSWFINKGEEDGDIYIHHLITREMRTEFRSGDNPKQLKQIRSGYFIGSELIRVEHDFAIKSAYDSNQRRSKEGQLYGYDSIRKGTEWIFSVNSAQKELLNEVGVYLVGKHNIGKSKTSQYGRVKIEKIEATAPFMANMDGSGDIIIYFESCAAFVDSQGNYTYQPEPGDLGVTSGNINWEKSQILTRSFAPWNGKRKTRDADKVCIDKGSVLFIENGTIDSDKIANGIGVHRNEGFGRVLINSDFLFSTHKDPGKLAYTPKIDTEKGKKNKIGTSIKKNGSNDSEVILWLETRANEGQVFSTVVSATNSFVKEHGKEFGNISSSQWGSIRERALRIIDMDKLTDELFKKDSGYLRHGKAEPKWINKYKILEEALSKVDAKMARHFLVNLCSEMAKKNMNSDAGEDK